MAEKVQRDARDARARMGLKGFQAERLQQLSVIFSEVRARDRCMNAVE